MSEHRKTCDRFTAHVLNKLGGITHAASVSCGRVRQTRLGLPTDRKLKRCHAHAARGEGVWPMCDIR